MASAVRTVGAMRATIETSASNAVAVMGVAVATSAASATNEVGALGAASAASAENAASARFPANKTYDRSRHRNKNVFVGSMDICDQLMIRVK